MLAAFGRAFGKLPEKPANCSKEQKQFLEQAVAGLAQDGKVICVRLALFAEMMKGKPWTPATLKEVGGTEGVGVTFLEETLQRRHRPAGTPLSPEGGPGRPEGPAARSRHATSRATCGRTPELLEASGYAGRPQDFDDLLRILDSEIRLITPTDPEGDGRSRGVRLAGRAGPEVLPAHARLPGPLAAGLADPQAEGNPPGPGRAAAGGTRAAVVRQAGEPAPALDVGMGQPSGCSPARGAGPNRSGR